MIIQETPMEYFKGLVEGAMRNQRLNTPEEVEFYLSNLLRYFMDAKRLGSGPLALQYLEALQYDDITSRRLLRELGDISLFISGFFPESIKRKVAGLPYYIRMGSLSYGRLASIYGTRGKTAPFKGIFLDLSGRFTLYVNILSEVSERTSLGTSRDVLGLYERWLNTKSRTALVLLRELGIEPCDSSDMEVAQ